MEAQKEWLETTLWQQEPGDLALNPGTDQIGLGVPQSVRKGK